jgi:predicted MPP superfamily phosphohydrolase
MGEMLLIAGLLALALLGHLALWVGVINRLHGVGLRRRLLKRVSWILRGLLVVPPLVLVGAVLWTGWNPQQFDLRAHLATPLGIYGVLCVLVATIQVPRWCWQRLGTSAPAAVVARSSRTVDVAARLGERPVSGRLARILTGLPGNEVLKVDFQSIELALPRLQQELDGLRIAHLSDLHLSGRIGKAYFAEVAQMVQEQQPDLVALTGDICEFDPQIAWIGDILGRIRGRLGNYFVLGNHDLRLSDTNSLVRELQSAGYVPMSGRTVRVSHGGAEAFFSGDSRPWYGDVPPVPEDSSLPRVLLAHTPDRFGWAARQGFDLVLAGHTHGGQVRLPLVGPVFCPSLYGVRYAGGTFQSGRTVMHVSRGLSGLHPLRFNCLPEVSILVLRAVGKPQDARHAARLAGTVG